jgi:hypothetical protein
MYNVETNTVLGAPPITDVGWWRDPAARGCRWPSVAPSSWETLPTMPFPGLPPASMGSPHQGTVTNDLILVGK